MKLHWTIKLKFGKLKNSNSYLKNRLLYLLRYRASAQNQKKSIVFVCGFHGKTGAVTSIANVANMLSKKNRVEFVTFSSSNYNSLLTPRVRLISDLHFDADLYICDLSCKHETLNSIKVHSKKILISCHGMLHSQYGLSPEYKLKSISYADKVHFVNPIQNDEYKLPHDRCILIPNTVDAIRKRKASNDVGTVGNLNLKNKNVEAAVSIAMASHADRIHLWSINSDRWKNSRVVVHEWQNNKEKIYDSFDVLVFMSQEEALSMVVLEAMSAGIPCLLSDIPAFRYFSNAPGVALVSPSDQEKACEFLNDLLANKGQLKPKIRAYWNQEFSMKAVAEMWDSFIDSFV
jgi:glycosyltransferase involved in cell wall biosynthesis